jgi:deoxyribonuclease V
MPPPAELHSWSVTIAEAVRLQTVLRDRLILRWDGRRVETVAGIDVHFRGGAAIAAIVVLSFPALERVEEAEGEAAPAMPYVPGLLAFREGPAILAAWASLRREPDLLLFDGHGTAHPRGFGLACHLGLWLDRPSVGVAKSRLLGAVPEPGPEPGSAESIAAREDPARVVGASLRTRRGSRPVYVSPGHRIDLPQSLEFSLRCCRGFRLPEPLRLAHGLAARCGRQSAEQERASRNKR